MEDFFKFLSALLYIVVQIHWGLWTFKYAQFTEVLLQRDVQSEACSSTAPLQHLDTFLFAILS